MLGNRYKTDAQRWQAVTSRDPAAAEAFRFAVKTTGVYCRATCPARRPRRENVAFFTTSAAAERAGYRPCKRCKPNAPSQNDDRAAMVRRACELLARADRSPTLAELARTSGLSPFHFHRIFKSVTGVTPKAYAVTQRAKHMKNTLPQSSTVTSAIYNASYGSPGRFYATAKRELGMTPATFRKRGDGATIRFAVARCSLGPILVAASDLGVCHIAIGDGKAELTRELKSRFSRATFIEGDAAFGRLVAQAVAFIDRPGEQFKLPLHVQGTTFQHRVWKALSEIPAGETRTYAEVARDLGQPSAARAVAGACAANNLAIAIPCHRVVRSDGGLSGYRWGPDVKAKLLQAEAAAR